MGVVTTGSRAAGLVLALLLPFAGCGFEGDLPTPTRPPTPPAPPSGAALNLSLNESPVEAVPGGEGGTPWSAAFTVNVREGSGIGGQIDFVRATLADASGGLLAETELDAGEVSAQLGDNRIAGGGREEIPLSLNFAFPADVSSADLHVTVEVRDDRGNTVTAAADDKIQVCVPTLLAPTEAAKMDNGCTVADNGLLWEFDWEDCAGAESYDFYVQRRSQPEPLIDVPDLETSAFTVLEDRVVPEGSRLGWFWKVRAKVNGVYGDWSPETNFDVEPGNTDCVNP
jgi:hypothetical protein